MLSSVVRCSKLFNSSYSFLILKIWLVSSVVRRPKLFQLELQFPTFRNSSLVIFALDGPKIDNNCNLYQICRENSGLEFKNVSQR